MTTPKALASVLISGLIPGFAAIFAFSTPAFADDPQSTMAIEEKVAALKLVAKAMATTRGETTRSLMTALEQVQESPQFKEALEKAPHVSRESRQIICALDPHPGSTEIGACVTSKGGGIYKLFGYSLGLKPQPTPVVAVGFVYGPTPNLRGSYMHFFRAGAPSKDGLTAVVGEGPFGSGDYPNVVAPIRMSFMALVSPILDASVANYESAYFVLQ